MGKLLLLFFTLSIFFTALPEKTCAGAQTCSASCLAVCSGGVCGTYCGEFSLSISLAPITLERPAVSLIGAVFAARLSEDEVFHPPVV